MAKEVMPDAAAFMDVCDELARARCLFAKFSSAHEGYSIILEELDELWTEIKSRNRTSQRMYKEATQVAAMAIRFMIDVCGFEWRDSAE